jgi:HPt (histidine-containing phosphotransfer) domain-containing protein
MKTAERLAHTLKGVSATLGIKRPSEAAAVVEDRIRHDRLGGSKPIWRQWKRHRGRDRGDPNSTRAGRSPAIN